MKGWRTILFNLLTIAATLPAIPGLDPRVLLEINVIGNLVLRMVTTSPVTTAS